MSRFIAAAKHPAFVCLLLVMVTIAVFWRVKDFDFINYDDPDYFTANVHVQQGLTLEGVLWAFTTSHAGNWHPLTWLSLMLDKQLFGMTAAGPHVVNLLIHVANAILLFLVLRQLTGEHWQSAFVAALFALHPLHVESVAWISERKDVLSTFFGLLALMIYARYSKNSQGFQSSSIRNPAPCALYLAAVIVFALSLMAKPMLVTLPFLLLLLDYWPLGRFRTSPTPSSIRVSLLTRWPIVREKIPFFILSVISCIVTIVVQQKGGAVKSLIGLSLDARLENAIISYARYLGKTFWPVDLAIPYPHPGQWPWMWAVWSAVLVVGLSVVAVWFCRRLPFVFTGWFWFLGTLIPVIGLIQVGHQSLADRYTYMPLVGVFIVLAWSAGLVLERLRYGRIVAALSAVGILMLCAIGTARQLRHWTDSVTLFEHTLSVTTSNAVAHVSLGVALRERGKLAESIQSYKNAISIKPDFAEAYNNLGDLLAAQGRLSEAIGHFETAVQIRPGYVEAHNNLGTVLSDLGRPSEAVEHYQRALEIKPNYAEAHNNLANALRSQGKVVEAIEHYQWALQLKPHLVEAHYNLAVALAGLNRLAEAIEYYQLFLKIKPDYAVAHYELGDALRRSGRFESAITHYRKAVELRPGHIEAKNTLAWLLATCPEASLRDGNRAVELAMQADRLAGGKYPEILDTLAASYAQTGRFTEAVQIARKAIQLANAQSNAVLADAVRDRLRLYETNSPYHEKLHVHPL